MIGSTTPTSSAASHTSPPSSHMNTTTPTLRHEQTDDSLVNGRTLQHQPPPMAIPATESDVITLFPSVTTCTTWTDGLPCAPPTVPTAHEGSQDPAYEPYANAAHVNGQWDFPVGGHVISS